MILLPTEYSFKAKYLLILGLKPIKFKIYKYYYKIYNIFLDMTECKISNGGCQHHCKNKNGSYVCECNTGFFLDRNGKTCSGKLYICNCPESSLKNLF